MENTLVKIMAVFGVAALVIKGGQSAAAAILNNVEITPDTPVLDYSTSPIGADGEIYARIDLPVIVKNSNSFPLVADYFTGVIKYGNIVLTEVRSADNLHVPANSTKTIVINVNVPTKRVFNDVKQQVQSGNLANTFLNKILFTGYIQLSAFGNYYQYPLMNIPIPLA